MFVIISGMTCTGKSTLANELIAKGFTKVTSTTTRPRREDEIAEYNFISKDEFEQKIINKQILEYVEHGEHLYGLEIAEVAKLVGAGKHSVIVMEPQGFKKLKRYLEANDAPYLSVFLMCDKAIVVKRLVERETDSDALVDRLATMLEVESKWERELHNYDMMLRTDDSPISNCAQIVIDHVQARMKNSLSKRKQG